MTDLEIDKALALVYQRGFALRKPFLNQLGYGNSHIRNNIKEGT
jgi:hypothetical protein